jgi:hypothetical protein
VAIGVLFWANAVLVHPYFTRSLAFVPGVKAICRLLADLIKAHPLQHPHAFAILRLVLETRPQSDLTDAQVVTEAQLTDVRRVALDGMLALVREGYFYNVLDYVSKTQTRLDLSLLRHFLLAAMQIADSPENAHLHSWARSSAFAAGLNALLNSPAGKKAGVGGEAEFAKVAAAFKAARRLV